MRITDYFENLFTGYTAAKLEACARWAKSEVDENGPTVQICGEAAPRNLSYAEFAAWYGRHDGITTADFATRNWTTQSPWTASDIAFGGSRPNERPR